jgi:aldose 1-epimerase
MIVLDHPGTASSPAVQLSVDADDGGRIAALRIGRRVVLVAGDPHGAPDGQPMSWGSFLMAPWAGRVRRGRFSLDGVEHHLDVNLPPHAIHGTTFTRPWTVDLVDGSDVTMSVPLGWELGGTAQQRIAVTDREVRCELSVTAGDQPMPAEVGWHPWFVLPDELVFEPEAMYRRDDEGIPDGTLVPPGPQPWDDCFVGADRAVLRWRGTEPLELTVTSDCDHWVVYTEPTHAACVEPQSGPPDAFNLRPRILAPGTTLTRTMWWRW